MEGKRNYNGELEIKRGDRLRPQTCPHKNVFCGDWCPKFGEPEAETKYKRTMVKNEETIFFNKSLKTGHTILKICGETLIFNNFTDERE